MKINNYVWSQFGASINMLENAIDACPENVWNQQKEFSDFWYIVYHTLFWLDFYLTENPEKFVPFQSIGLSELDPEGIMPDREFSKEELKAYLNHCRIKCKETIFNQSELQENSDYKFGTLTMPFYELFFYNMRHVQHHVAQLNLLLRQQTDSAPKWVRRNG
ncbi:MAG: DinB family protein [Ignavibacteriaceae bacterium]|nr:DinB family protein [Ignavibacteriaceae bacterium]